MIPNFFGGVRNSPRLLDPSRYRLAQIKLPLFAHVAQLCNHRQPNLSLSLTKTPLSLSKTPLSSLDQGVVVIIVEFCLAVRQSRMTRGNQRERDRERAQARAGTKSKNPKEDGLTPEQRRERDARALQEKAARKSAQAASGGNSSGDNRSKKK
ncbi:uncharacterized protein LOC132269645 [Cornus florida]|uniref:uncharacterized protein LOC132269645 n=1 Tax=Cornus florida TaxID=4283 RepID=UPI0028A2198E|nr:uncharacterized protein LOC132269645 [Cornus florida]